MVGLLQLMLTFNIYRHRGGGIVGSGIDVAV